MFRVVYCQFVFTCRFFSLMFMLTDCSCRVWISLLILLKSPWKPFSISSIRWIIHHNHDQNDTKINFQNDTNVKYIWENYLRPYKNTCHGTFENEKHQMYNKTTTTCNFFKGIFTSKMVSHAAICLCKLAMFPLSLISLVKLRKTFPEEKITNLENVMKS